MRIEEGYNCLLLDCPPLQWQNDWTTNECGGVSWLAKQDLQLQ